MSENEVPARSRWQFGLGTLFLLVAATAVWIAHAVNQQRIGILQQRIQSLSPLARELVVDDPTQAAVVQLDPQWFDENRWELHLPEGSYQLCLATRDVADKGLTRPTKTVPLGPGSHRIMLESELHEDGWHVLVGCDGAVAFNVVEPKEWDPGLGSTGGSEISVSRQMSSGKPIELFRRRFYRDQTRNVRQSSLGPCEGILLWIEPAGTAH